MTFTTFLINLDRATERLETMQAQLDGLQLDYTRIPAILGDALPVPTPGFDARAYRIRTGKHQNKGEIGCYFSHLKAMETFLQTDVSHALVLEDDAVLPNDFVSLLQKALLHEKRWDLLRLSSSREGAFLPITQLDAHYQLAINTRVLKNTAAYMVNRRAAKAISTHLRIMKLPYDVALDRDWTMGIRSACAIPFPVELADVPGQITKARRIPVFRATTFHYFHLIDRVRRSRYRRKVFSKQKMTFPSNTNQQNPATSLPIC